MQSKENPVHSMIDKKTSWIVFDIRLAGEGVSSGISRFIFSLIQHLAPLLASPSSPGLLLISHDSTPLWVQQLMQDLVQEYPKNPPAHIEFLQWKGPWWCRHRKFPWLWSTLAFQQVVKKTHNRCVWIAPANTDRPLLGWCLKKHQHHVVQVIHDLIPLQPKSPLGRLFRWQFSFFVKRSLKRLPHIFTVSNHSAEEIQRLRRKLSPVKLRPPVVIPNGVSYTFGRQNKYPVDSLLCLQERQKNFEFCLREEEKSQLLAKQDAWTSFIQGVWLISVGRSEPYKRWDFAHQVVQILNERSYFTTKTCWWIRVGANEKEIQKFGIPTFVFKNFQIFLEQKLVVIHQPVNDAQLENLYRCGDLMLHPSIGEGFGLPPLEAALTGLPVLYDSTTAVTGHFPEGFLPESFWCGLNSEETNLWCDQALRMLVAARGKEPSEFYNGLYQAGSSRNFLRTNKMPEDWHSWNSTAQDFLRAVQNIDFKTQET